MLRNNLTALELDPTKNTIFALEGVVLRWRLLHIDYHNITIKQVIIEHWVIAFTL